MIAAFRGLEVMTPFGPITYRHQDHQSTMGAYVGTLDVRDGKGVMTDVRYVDGASVLPSDEQVRQWRPASAQCRRGHAERCGVQGKGSDMTAATLLVQALNGLAEASSLFLVAVGLSLIFGVSRIVNFAHGSLYMLGLYGAWHLVHVWGDTPAGFWGAVLA